MTEHLNVEERVHSLQRVYSLLGNYDTRAKYAPEPPPTWADIVRDLRWALGHELGHADGCRYFTDSVLSPERKQP